ncbi:MAG: class I SAM-dependent methyltransferase [Lachnospiraceae bacterium]|nr:class I SAM-dependent methyltransferase [Lachnospiraceae bacterium]
MNTEKVIDFFNKLAPSWDAEMIRNEEIISRILDGARVSEGDSVLDVACGTGVLIPDYLSRGVFRVTGIDISPAMAEIAKEKFAAEERVTILCVDAAAFETQNRFDRIMIYNALPHFVSPKELFRHLVTLLAPQGTLTIAHGFGRKKLDDHHKNTASDVSVPLPSTEELRAYLEEKLEIIVSVDTEEMFQLTGQAPAAK